MDDAARTLLPIAAKHLTQLYLSGSLSVLGLDVAEAQSSNGIISVLFMLPFLAAMVALATRIWPGLRCPSALTNGPISSPRSA
jgi:hypothetical protein